MADDLNVSKAPQVVVQDVDPVPTGEALAVQIDNNSTMGVVDRNSLSPEAENYALPARVEQLRVDSTSASHSVSEEETSSGTEDDFEFTAPSDSVAQKISDIVDDYFDDENLLFDTFLLKHVMKQREGFVNLKLITSFKRLKKLTKDYRVVRFAVQKFSKKCEIHKEGKRIRRIDPLPDYRDTPQGRSCLLLGLPEPTLGLAAQLIEGCGKVECLRLLVAGKPVPPDTRKVIGKRPDLEVHCAFVHFWHFSSVEMLIAKQSQPDWPSSVSVERIKDSRQVGSNPGTPTARRANAPAKERDDFRRRAGSYENSRSRASTLDSSDNESTGEGRWKHGSRAGIDGNWREASLNSSPASSPGVSPRSSPRPGRRNGKHGRSPLAQATAESRSAGSSPAVERRPLPITNKHAHDGAHIVRAPIAPEARPAFGRGEPLPTVK